LFGEGLQTEPARGGGLETLRAERLVPLGTGPQDEAWPNGGSKEVGKCPTSRIERRK